jgi:hypothetical protein
MVGTVVRAEDTRASIRVYRHEFKTRQRIDAATPYRTAETLFRDMQSVPR